ncbi:MAG: hypothetical protein ACKVZH_10545 [Blastocatellia bacterium]
MKPKTFIALILLLAVGVTGCRISSHSKRAEVKTDETTDTTQRAGTQAELSITAGESSDDLAAKEEVRRKFKLGAESTINVNNVNGPVTVETADTDTVEVLIVRSAKTKEDLQNYRKVRIEEEGRQLNVNIENDRKSLFSSLGKIPEGHQRVILKIPRKMNFSSYGVNGAVTLGEIQGRVELNNINGQIKAARLAGQTQMGNVNGGIDATFAPLIGKGLEVYEVNGNVDLRFEGQVNANLSAGNIIGRLNYDLPGVQANDDDSKRNQYEDFGRGRLEARIGAGGVKLRISSVNGNVNLLKAENTSPSTAKAASK